LAQKIGQKILPQTSRRHGSRRAGAVVDVFLSGAVGEDGCAI